MVRLEEVLDLAAPVTDFSYRLVCLTHAAGGDTLPAALAAFEAHSTHQPAEVAVVVDGPEYEYVTEALVGRFEDARTTINPVSHPLGFCGATNRAWALAAAGPGPLHVFYLEHDFMLTRDVDLRDLAALLEAEPQLAQAALMRDAVNDTEKAAGGLFESRPGQYEPRWGLPTPGSELDPEWHEHRAYLTTNPSLMRRSFMQENPWPYDGRAECEGRFGIALVAAGFSFGVWGDGSPWCRHVGVRSGHGY